MSVSKTKSLLGVASKRAKRDPGPRSQQEVAEARQALAAAKIEAHIAEVVAAAPPLSEHQIARISALLLAGTVSARAASESQSCAGVAPGGGLPGAQREGSNAGPLRPVARRP